MLLSFKRVVSLVPGWGGGDIDFSFNSLMSGNIAVIIHIPQRKKLTGNATLKTEKEKERDPLHWPYFSYYSAALMKHMTQSNLGEEFTRAYSSREIRAHHGRENGSKLQTLR